MIAGWRPSRPRTSRRATTRVRAHRRGRRPRPAPDRIRAARGRHASSTASSTSAATSLIVLALLHPRRRVRRPRMPCSASWRSSPWSAAWSSPRSTVETAEPRQVARAARGRRADRARRRRARSASGTRASAPSSACFEIFMTLGGVAALVGLLSARTKRLGDLIAGTYSQYERVTPRAGAAVRRARAADRVGADRRRRPHARRALPPGRAVPRARRRSLTPERRALPGGPARAARSRAYVSPLPPGRRPSSSSPGSPSCAASASTRRCCSSASACERVAPGPARTAARVPRAGELGFERVPQRALLESRAQYR